MGIAVHSSLAWFLGLCLAGLLAACGDASPRLSPLARHDVVLAFGDSLTQGTGAAPDESYPARLQSLIGRQVVNAGVPGETTAEGLARLPGALSEHKPRLLLLCLGGNDMLRRQGGTQTADNLRAMVRMARSQGTEVVLIGVPEPGLFTGPPAFYAGIAAEFDLPYEAEAFNAVLRDPGLKSDPVHANGRGYEVVAQRLADLLRKAGAV